MVSPKKAVQLVLQVKTFSKSSRHLLCLKTSISCDVYVLKQWQMREKERGTENIAEKIANGLLNEARAMRTKDNTSIVYLGFDTSL